MHDLTFSDAIKPARTVVLRLPLKPYSIGHEIILLSRRSRFILAGYDQLTPSQKKTALAEAALVCSKDWAGNQRPEKFLWLWGWLIRWLDWEAEAVKFWNYLKAGKNAPPTETPEGPVGRELGAPFHAILIQFLMRELRLTETQCYDYPLALAKFLYYTAAEESGGVKIVNEAESAFEDYCKREDEKVLKTKEAKCPA